MAAVVGGSSKPVLVTGGAGYVGSHLCRHLLKRGHEVSCVGNFIRGKAATVASLLNTREFELLRHEVTIPLHVEIDEVFKLACPASPAPLSIGSGSDDQNLGSGRDQNAWVGEAVPPRDPPGVETFTVYGGVSQMRSFCFVDKLVEGLVA